MHILCLPLLVRGQNLSWQFKMEFTIPLGEIWLRSVLMALSLLEQNLYFSMIFLQPIILNLTLQTRWERYQIYAMETDLCGVAVGIMKKDSVIDGKSINARDVLIGLPSNGVHSYGFSLVTSGFSLKDQLPGESITLGEALIAPTVIYVKQVLDIISKGGVKGIAHITGGLFTHNAIFNDNIPRVLPKGLGALIYEGSWTIPPVYKWIQEAGRIEDTEMMQTFDMGIGMVLVASPEAADRILGEVQKTSIAYRIGEVVKGDEYSGHRWISISACLGPFRGRSFNYCFFSFRQLELIS